MIDNTYTGRSVDQDPPASSAAPKMYEWTVYLLGGIVVLAVLGLIVLAMTQRSAEAVITGLVAIGSTAVGGLVNLLNPKRQA